MGISTSLNEYHFTKSEVLFESLNATSETENNVTRELYNELLK